MSDLLDWLTENEGTFRKARLPSLYSDLSIQLRTNPDGYAANISAWQSALTKAALAGKLPYSSTANSLTLHASEELISALSDPRYGRPLGLGAVLDESVKSRKMIPRNDFLRSERSIYSRSWIPNPWTTFQWSLQQIGMLDKASYDANGRLRTAELVLVAAVEHVAAKVLKMQEKRGWNLTDRLTSRDTFSREIGLPMTESEVLLKFLARDKRVLSYDSKTIKFRAPCSAAPEPITSQDGTISSLKTLLRGLSRQCDVLSNRITALSTQASSAVKSGNRISALSALRSKKVAQKTLQSRSETLHQLEDVFSKIEQAADQVEIMDVMRSSAGVLKDLNKQVGGVEEVEDVVERLKEEMRMTDEVGNVLREPLAPEIVDETEVDQEFEAMEADERRRRLAEMNRKVDEVAAKRIAQPGQQAKTFHEEQAQRTEVLDGQDGQFEDADKRLSRMSLEDDTAKDDEIEVSKQQPIGQEAS